MPCTWHRHACCPAALARASAPGQGRPRMRAPAALLVEREPAPRVPPACSCWMEGADASAADEYVFAKLVALFEGRPGALGWDQLVELAQHAQLGDTFVLR